MSRKAYPGDVTADEWTFVAPYLTTMTEDAPLIIVVQRRTLPIYDSLV